MALVQAAGPVLEGVQPRVVGPDGLRGQLLEGQRLVQLPGQQPAHGPSLVKRGTCGPRDNSSFILGFNARLLIINGFPPSKIFIFRNIL